MKGEISYMLEYEKDKENSERNVNFFGDEFIIKILIIFKKRKFIPYQLLYLF